MSQQKLDYIWINDEYEIKTFSIVSDVIHNNIDNISDYYIENKLIKPYQMFNNPFRTNMDRLILCDTYNILENAYILLCPNNKRKELSDNMDTYEGTEFKLTQTFMCEKTNIKLYKEMCKYVGIDIKVKPFEYSIYSNRNHIYSCVLISRYILINLFIGYPVYFLELTLIPDEVDDLVSDVTKMGVSVNYIL